MCHLKMILKKLTALSFLIISYPIFAALPTMEAPSRGKGKGIVETLKNHGYDFIILAGLLICAIAFLVVAKNCIATFNEIQDGKKKWTDLGMMAGVGALILVLAIWLITEASDIL